MNDETQNTNTLDFKKYFSEVMVRPNNFSSIFKYEYHDYNEGFAEIIISQIKSLQNALDENAAINDIKNEDFTLHFNNKENI